VAAASDSHCPRIFEIQGDPYVGKTIDIPGLAVVFLLKLILLLVNTI
jgi:hypothetical protein